MNWKTWRLTASVVLACGALGAASASAAISVQVLSSKPQLVSGGDALVKITGATAAPTVTVDGKDVSAAFKAANGAYVGLVTGLKDGANALVAKAGADQGTATLVNHGINDTLFAGPQQQPFVCENDAWKLAAPTDANCSAPAMVNYYYRNKAGDWKPFDAANRPADLTTTKIGGKDVPLIARQEIGVINRSAYVISILHDPAAGPAPTPTDRGGSAWNGKLAMSFGPGVGAGYHSGRNIGQFAANKQWLEDGNPYFDTLITSGSHGLVGDRRVRHPAQRCAFRRRYLQGEGALHRDVRRADVHHRPGSVGRLDAAEPDRQCLSGHSRRHHAGAPLHRHDHLPAAAV
jgi:hypothetical protein